MKKENLLGKKFGMLTVINESDSYVNKRVHASRWECQCECGNKKVVLAQSLKSGATKSCGCLLHSKPWKGYEEISGSYWNITKRSAKKRNKKFNITIEEAWDLYIKQNKKCALSGLDLEFVRNYLTMNKEKRVRQSASLDRIDSALDYTIDNVQWVHVDINYMKQWHSDEYFIKMCKHVAKYR